MSNLEKAIDALTKVEHARLSEARKGGTSPRLEAAIAAKRGLRQAKNAAARKAPRG